MCTDLLRLDSFRTPDQPLMSPSPTLREVAATAVVSEHLFMKEDVWYHRYMLSNGRSFTEPCTACSVKTFYGL